jgi:hypothetical protein
MYHFCTYFNKNFLVRGLTLYHSLLEHGAEFRLYVLCFDEETYRFLKEQDYPAIVPISQQEFEKGDADLVACKNNRSVIEYFFTCTPSLPLYVFNNFPDVTLLSYVDADMFLFSSPEPIFSEMGDDSILIIPHRFSENNKLNERFGRYNVGFLSFRNDVTGLECLRWWRGKCIEWCYDREEPTRFADQKYLNYWPELFAKVCVLTHKGVNLAPWNVDNYSYRKVGADVLVDDDRLIIYHFNSLNKRSAAVYNLGTRSYAAHLSRVLLSNVYKVYIQKMNAISRSINLQVGDNRTKQKYPNLMYQVLAMAESEEVVYFPKYGMPVRVSRLLRPIVSVKKRIKSLTRMLRSTKNPALK